MMKSNPTYVKRSSGKAIFSSKMFLSSKNQDKIRAAFENDENIELIQQLDEYIGDEFVKLKKQSADSADSDPNESPKQKNSETDTEEGTESKKTIDTDIKAIRPSKPTEDAEVESDVPDTDESSESDEPSEEQPIENSTTIKSTTIIMHPEYEDAVNEIKGFLNANSSTAGVSRVRRKDDEIWIYYKDTVNLNNIMDTVIEILTNGYLWMIFNRLARSENAIVFAILEDDTLKNLPSPPVTHEV